MDGCHVIKIGGSLFDIAGDIIQDIITSAHRVIVVPGGGPFVDLAARCNVGEEESHWMAVAGMEQYGWYLSSFGISACDTLVVPRDQSVFLPYRVMREEDPLPHTWDVTSDTIAAWVAWRLNGNLVLLKSVDGISIDGNIVPSLTTPVPSGEVDPCLVQFVLGHQIPTCLINGRRRERLISYLNGERVPGTVIGTTF
ncbi:MAG TPA: uridylate kinase [Methanoregulaceae archaeon]|nr:uridylate kinase [Methanoregulaceae archaeon]